MKSTTLLTIRVNYLRNNIYVGEEENMLINLWMVRNIICLNIKSTKMTSNSILKLSKGAINTF